MKISAGKSVLVAILLVIMIGSGTVRGQATNPFSDMQASHIFGSQITFNAVVIPAKEADRASLTIRLTATNNSIVLPAALKDDSLLSASYDPADAGNLPAFTQMEYWFTLSYMDGSQVESQRQPYTYTDNRYTWQTLNTSENAQVHWVEGDLAFGQAVADEVTGSQAAYSPYLDLPFPDGLAVYVYPDVETLQSALEISNIPWVSGHANTTGNTIMVAIPTGFDQQLDIQRQIPHEITHIRLSLYMGENYSNLPVWFNEGLASLAEEYTSPAYWQILQAAYENNTLLPFSQLCQSFPPDAQSAGLAYAQSDSFVRYLHTEYGKAGLIALTNAYLNGQTCAKGTEAALGRSLDKLEADWYRATFKSGMIPRSLSAILTWVLLLGLLLTAPIILSISSFRKQKGASSHE